MTLAVNLETYIGARDGEGEPHGQGKGEVIAVSWVKYARDEAEATEMEAVFSLSGFRPEPRPHGLYDGEWEHGLPHGKGKYVFTDGRRNYEGDVRNGHPHGHGTWTYPTQVYVGEVVVGNPHGHGKATWDDGATYVGQWKEGRPHDGVFTSSNGEVNTSPRFDESEFVEPRRS